MMRICVFSKCVTRCHWCGGLKITCVAFTNKFKTFNKLKNK